MGVITISLTDDVERELRRLALIRYNQKKGHLSFAISEALKEWAVKVEDNSVSKSLELLENGLKLGKLKTSREDWHGR